METEPRQTTPPTEAPVLSYASGRPTRTPRQAALGQASSICGWTSLLLAVLGSLILCAWDVNPFAWLALMAGVTSVVTGILAGRDIHKRIIGGWGFACGMGVTIVVGATLLASLLDGGGPRAQARQALCLSNLKCIGTAIGMYQAANKGVPPADLTVLIDGRFLSDSLLHCPAVDANATGRITDYCFLAASAPASRPAGQIIIACDLQGNHGSEGRAVLFADDSVRWLSEPDFQALLAKPQNAAFATALRQAEAGPAIAPVSYPPDPQGQSEQ